MGKTRRAKNRKKFGYGVNRRKVNLKRRQKLLPRIPNDIVRDAWDHTKHTKSNLESMGLAYKVNKTISLKPWGCVNSSDEAESVTTVGCVGIDEGTLMVVDRLQEHVDNAPKWRAMRLPREMVRFVEDMMERHGANYVAMSRDAVNYNQLTPNQLRHLVRRFWNIPDHYASYMKRRGLLVKPDLEANN